jgi:hypothetical protein
MAGAEGYGLVRLGLARTGWARQVRHGLVRCGGARDAVVGHGWGRRGSAGKVPRKPGACSPRLFILLRMPVMRLAVALVLALSSACATTGDALVDRRTAREQRDAGTLIAVGGAAVGAGAMAGAVASPARPATGEITPESNQRTVAIVWALVGGAAVGLVSVTTGVLVATDAVDALE